jgi:tetratricopeptide (TPR) repeat protein
LLAINNLVSLALDNPPNKELMDRAMSLAERLKGSQVPQFLDTYGWSEYRRGDIKGAIATLEAARAKLNNLAAIRYHLGMSYLAAGDKDKANEEFKAASGIEADGTTLKKNILEALKQSG